MDKIALEIGRNSLEEKIGSFSRRCIYSVLSVGPIPNHIAFIMDGNRRYARKHKMAEGAGHHVGFMALLSVLRYCYELGVQYATVYAFSIDNFRRRPDEVQLLMDLMLEKIDTLVKEESFVNRYGVRVHFAGNLTLLSEPVREAAHKAMAATAHNTKGVLCVCIAYTSTDEIANAVQQSCKEKYDMPRGEPKPTEGDGVNGDYHRGHSSIKLADIEKHMYMAVVPDPDILIRTSGETRLSNFLLWQTTHSYMYNPRALWPELGFWNLFWGVLNFQRHHAYLEKKKKQF